VCSQKASRVAIRVTEPNGTVRFVLSHGVEIHRIGPPQEVYDYDTGKLVGRVGPRGCFVPLGADLSVEAAQSKSDKVEIQDF
jgi:hypothetical protein